MGILSSPMEVINTVTGRVAVFFTLLVYALQGNQWTITDILYIIAWCDLVRQALCGDLLLGFYYGAEVYFSALRIQVLCYIALSGPCIYVLSFNSKSTSTKVDKIFRGGYVSSFGARNYVSNSSFK